MRFNRPSTPLIAAICLGVLVALVALVIGTRPGGTDRPSASDSSPDLAGVQEPGIEFEPVGEETTGPAPTPGTLPTPTPGHPVPTTAPAPPPSPKPTPAAPQPTYSGLTGYHCQQDETKGFARVNRWQGANLTGWYSVSTGAWAKDGCDGAFDTMPMNGSATKVDYAYYAEWWFKVGTASKTCDLATYIPVQLQDTDVQGDPAYHEIRDGTSSTVHAVRTVSQASNQGKWVSLGTHAVIGGKIVIRIRNQGTDPNNEHIAIAATRVVCHS